MAFARSVSISATAAHTTTVTGADDPTKEINKDQWNGTSAHSVAASGTESVSGADVGGIPYCPTATTETTSANLTFNGTSLFAGATNGSAATPTISFVGATGNGLVSLNTSDMSLCIGGVRIAYVSSNRLSLASDTFFYSLGASANAGIGYGGANQLIFGIGSAGGAATSRAEINKAVTAFTDAAAKTVFTLTIPNAAHSASYLVRVTGSIGAGGAIGANEASATNAYVVTIARTAGVNAVAGISAAFGASTAAVAGATTVTCTAGLGAVGGGVGASNTITLDVTITKGGGSSDNHTCVATASLLNANATGITIA